LTVLDGLLFLSIGVSDVVYNFFVFVFEGLDAQFEVIKLFGEVYLLFTPIDFG